MQDPILIFFAFLTGLLLAGLYFKRAQLEAIRQRDIAQSQLEGQKAQQEAVTSAQKETAEMLQQKILESFEGVASKALHSNQDQFLKATELKMGPLYEKLNRLQEATQGLKKLDSTAQELGRRSDALATALRGSSTARGQWGEQSVERIFELAGMKKGIHYFTQKVVENQLRPDFQILLAGGKDRIPLDAKAPFTAYYDSLQEENVTRKKDLLRLHEQNVREHIRILASKDYQNAVEGDVDFTVMYVPGDHLLDAAFEQNPNLLEHAWSKRVLLATPVTLLSLLSTVGYQWSRVEQGRKVNEIAEAAKELHTRMRVFTEHVAKMGTHMDRAVKSYNEVVGSYNRKVLPQGRRLESMQATEAGKPIAELKPIETSPRKDLQALPSAEEPA